MKLTRIELDGFGCLSGFREDLAPGLHLFHGPNESGKSTLQQAIIRLLFGFYQGNRALARESEARRRYTPWENGPYGGRLEYELESSRRYRIQRDFSSTDVPTSVWDLSTGTDVTDQFGRGAHGNITLAREHLGMTKNVFEACAFVSQGELFDIADEALTSPQEIGDAVVALADSARRDISAQSAIDRLDNALRTQVGTPRSRTTPLPVARRRLGEAEEELRVIDEIREGVADDAAALERLDDRAADLQEAMQRLQYLVLRAEANDLDDWLALLQSLAEADESLKQELASTKEYSEFPVHELDSVRERWARVRNLRERVKGDADNLTEARQRLEELNRRREPLGRRHRELSHLEAIPEERSATVEEATASWRGAVVLEEEAARRLGEAQLSEELLGEYQSLKDDVGNLTPSDIEQLTQSRRSLAGPEVGILGRLLRGVGSAITWVLTNLASGARWLWRTVTRRPPPTQVELEEDGDEVPESGARPLPEDGDVTALLGRYWRFLQLGPSITAYQTARGEANSAQSNVSGLKLVLREALAGIVDESLDIEEALEEFTRRVHGHREVSSLTEQLESLDGERSSLQNSIDGFERDEERLSTIESTLVEELRRTEDDAADLEGMVANFEAGCRKRGAYEEARRALRENEERRGIILQGRSPQELEDRHRTLQAEVDRLLGDNPLLEGAESSESHEALAAELSQKRQELQECELEIREKRTRIAQELDQLRSRAEVEEEIEESRSTVETLERFGDELRIAVEAAEEAMTTAHRDFAPSVGRFLGDGLSRITDGRYTEAYLDPSSLRVTAQVPETQRIVDVEFLSRGTRAAAYLLLRMGLAQHMSGMGEPVPLILDDPLVDLDDDRLDRFLDLLLELTAEAQILLFSKDEETRFWFDRKCSDNSNHRISLMSIVSRDGSLA